AYDSSIAPIGRVFADEPHRRFAHRHETNSGAVWEFPISTTRLLRWNLPFAGGNWMRQLPQWFVRRAADRWHRAAGAPMVMYFHVWELDPEQPPISAGSLLPRLRPYRTLHRTEGRLEYFFRRYAFTSVARHLGLEPESVQVESPHPSRHS